MLTVECSFGQGLLLETLVLSVLNHDTAVASAAARMVLAAHDRPLLEMGSRRTHEQAAVAAARAAYVAGFSATSNLEAGRRHGLPTIGTSAHAFTLAHPDERDRLRRPGRRAGPGTTLLVDTYDTEQGIRNAIAVAGTELGASGSTAATCTRRCTRARRLLDELGATATKLVVTGDLDEHAIAGLAHTAADSYGVGTSVVTGSGRPDGGLRLQARRHRVRGPDDAPADTRGEALLGQAHPRRPQERLPHLRRRRPRPRRDTAARRPAAPGRRPRAAAPLPEAEDLHAARARCAASLAELPDDARRLDPGTAAWQARLLVDAPCSGGPA